MTRITYISLCLCLTWITAGAQLTVYPGDINDNGEVNNIDLLYLGYGIGTTGPARNTPSTNWTPWNAPMWMDSLPVGINYAYLDANGDGVIDIADRSVIQLNYDSTQGTVMSDSLTPIVPGAPPLAINFASDSIVFSNDTLLTLDLILGDSNNPVANLHGLAFSIVYDSNYIDSLSVNFTGGFIGTPNNTLKLVRARAGRIDLAITRSNQTLANGFGDIGTIGVVLDDNLRPSVDFSVGLRIERVVAFGQNAFQGVPLEVLNDTIHLRALTAVGREEPKEKWEIYPVPADQFLAIRADRDLKADLQLYDLRGQLVRQVQFQYENEIVLPTGDLTPGIYFLYIRQEEAVLRQKILVRHP